MRQRVLVRAAYSFIAQLIGEAFARAAAMLVPMSQRRRHNWAKPVGGGIVEVIVSTAIISENFRANPSIDHKDDRRNRGMKGGNEARTLPPSRMMVWTRLLTTRKAVRWKFAPLKKPIYRR